MAFLKIDNITKSYGNDVVLQPCSFTLEKGEVLVIVGKSGSGKTTLLRCLNFLEKADKGQIYLNDELFYDFEVNEKVKDKQKKFGMVFQSFNLFPHYTVLKNLTLAPSLRGENKNELNQKALALLDKVGLKGKESFYPYQLSGGGCQRVAITRCLMLDPEVVCFDEPTSALDPELTFEVLKAIKSLKDENRAMIIVTHEIEFAKGIADKVMVMSEGEILEYGDSSILVNPKNKKVQAFLSQDLSV